MPSLRLESARDVMRLDDVFNYDSGAEALAGVTGLGLPPVAVQYAEGAGDGARYLGKRYLPRDIDLPIYVEGGDREGLKLLMARLSKILDDDACRLYFTDDRDEEWYAEVQRVGGGDYEYGNDTIGEDDLLTTLTLRAGSPYFTSTAPRTHKLQSNAHDGLLKGNSLVQLRVSDGSNFGQIDLDNPGDAPAYGLWTAYGPGSNVELTSPSGEELRWEASLASGEWVKFDMATGRCWDSSGRNRYNALARPPRFWAIPSDRSTAVATMEGIAPGVSAIEVTYVPRRRLVI